MVNHFISHIFHILITFAINASSSLVRLGLENNNSIFFPTTSNKSCTNEVENRCHTALAKVNDAAKRHRASIPQFIFEKHFGL